MTEAVVAIGVLGGLILVGVGIDCGDIKQVVWPAIASPFIAFATASMAFGAYFVFGMHFELLLYDMTGLVTPEWWRPVESCAVLSQLIWIVYWWKRIKGG